MAPPFEFCLLRSCSQYLPPCAMATCEVPNERRFSFLCDPYQSHLEIEKLPIERLVNLCPFIFIFESDNRFGRQACNGVMNVNWNKMKLPAFENTSTLSIESFFATPRARECPTVCR